MARKPNYDFERREREKAKAAKTAERIKAKTEAVEQAPAASEIDDQIKAQKDRIAKIPPRGEPSPEAGMNTMRKAVAENDLTKLRNRRARLEDGESK